MVIFMSRLLPSFIISKLTVWKIQIVISKFQLSIKSPQLFYTMYLNYPSCGHLFSIDTYSADTFSHFHSEHAIANDHLHTMAIELKYGAFYKHGDFWTYVCSLDARSDFNLFFCIITYSTWLMAEEQVKATWKWLHRDQSFRSLSSVPVCPQK